MPRWVQVVVGIAVAFAVLLGVAYAFRSELATQVAQIAVKRSDSLECTPPRIEVAASLELAELEPIECKIRRGPMTRAQTFGRTRVRLAGFGVEHVYIPRAVMDFRERDVSHVKTNTLGDLADLVGMTDGLIKGVLDGRDSYSSDNTPLTVGHLTQLRAGKKDAVMYDYSEKMDGRWVHSHAARVSTGVEGLVEARNFDLRVLPTRARLTMGIYLGKAERGEKPDAELRLDARDLDAPHPKVDLSLATGESRDARAARRQDDARAARSSKAVRE